MTNRHAVWLVIAVATVVAAALRLPFLAHQSLWFDEIFTRAVVSRHSLSGIWDQVRATESTPPLYYLLAKLSTDIAGTRSAAAMRAPSAVALTMAVPVTYLGLRRLLGQGGAAAAAGFVAVNPLLTNYSTDARSYGLFVLMALLSLWGFSAVLSGDGRGAYAGWAAASVACLWTHYFAVYPVAAEALILLVVRRDARCATCVWILVIAVCAAPLVPLLVHQNGSEDSAFIAGISLTSRIEQTMRQFAMGANVPRAWLEAAGLVVLGGGVAAGAAVAVRRGGSRILLAIASFSMGLPLLMAIAGIDDRFYVRNLIVVVPLIGALAAAMLLRLRAAPLIIYLCLATVTSVWVATNWRYEQADWRTAIARADPLDVHIPVITVGVDSANVAATYLDRTPAGNAVVGSRVLLIVQPYRGPGDRALVPAPVPAPISTELRGFSTSRTIIAHGFRLILLRASRPVTVVPANLDGATVFPAVG